MTRTWRVERGTAPAAELVVRPPPHPAGRTVSLLAVTAPAVVLGLDFGYYLTGSILTETIFSWPGIGKWLVESIGRRDYPALQGGIMLIASVVILVNLIIDLLYGLINPRIRHGH